VGDEQPSDGAIERQFFREFAEALESLARRYRTAEGLFERAGRSFRPGMRAELLTATRGTINAARITIAILGDGDLESPGGGLSMWAFLKKTFGSRNGILGAIATVVGTAGAVVALPIALPAALVAVATKVVIYGTTAGVIAAKVLPGGFPGVKHGGIPDAQKTPSAS
jgi:hypothetical protein